jgi:hypothetical protein
MVELAMQGKGKIEPLYEIAPALNLSEQQGKAVAHILTTSNRVSIIRGAAGTGKTTLLKEAISKIEDAGKSVIVVAPSSQASRGVLKEEEGIDSAETVARLLVDTDMQSRLKGQVLWVDEAGLLGTKDMTALLELATKQDARLVLGGDTRQHAIVVRGDALRVLNKFARIPTAEVTKIYRQQNEEYKSAVKDLSDGNMIAGFNKLDQLGFIKTVEQAEAAAQLADGYLEVIKSGKSALVVCPTHAQAQEVTQRIRSGMKEGGLLGKKEIDILKLKNLNLTDAEKADPRNYDTGQIVKFHQNVSGFAKGSLWAVEIKDKDIFLINKSDDNKPIPISKCQHYSVYDRQEITIAKGDRVMMTDGSTDRSGKRLDNGTMLTVTKVTKDGTFELVNEKSKTSYILDKDFGSINYAHCITSHASQGKTVDEVFIYQPATTFGATDAKQFYVSVSRGKQKAHLYTDDKEELLAEVQHSGERQSALELDNSRNRQRQIEPDYSITTKQKIMSLTEKFDRKRAAQASQQDADSAKDYPKGGTIRYVSFVMLDGKREFFCYSDLVRCAFDPEKNEINLTFRGAASVTLKGQNMLLLYEQFQNQIPRQVICVDKRYISLNSGKDVHVTKVNISNNISN